MLQLLDLPVSTRVPLSYNQSPLDVYSHNKTAAESGDTAGRMDASNDTDTTTQIVKVGWATSQVSLQSQVPLVAQ